jgi:hypothetical protein
MQDQGLEMIYSCLLANPALQYIPLPGYCFCGAGCGCFLQAMNIPGT